MSIRVTYLDDAPHVRHAGRVHALNATFHRFAARLLDVPGPDGAPLVAALTACVPVRDIDHAPATLALDSRIRVIGTAPFDGIAGFVPRAPILVARNLVPLRRAIAGADVVLLRLPASNGPAAAAIARLLGVPRLGYIAGSARAVVAGQARHGPAGAAAGLVARAYDAATRVATLGASRVVVGADLAGGGLVASLVGPREIRDPVTAESWPRRPGELRLAWSGRLADGKGVDQLLAALAALRADAPQGRSIHLVLLGDGPAAAALLRRASELAISDAVTFAGYFASRPTFLDALAAADLFVHPSPAEGFPKVVLDAMAVGIPVLAAPAGELAAIAAPAGRPATASRPIAALEAPDAAGIERGIRHLVAAPDLAAAHARAGSAFVAAHTGDAEAARLADLLATAARGRRPA